MTDKVFNEMWATLLLAYPREAPRMGAATQQLYFNDLQEIPDSLFVPGVEKARATSKFFPAIAEIGAASMGCSEGTWKEELARWKEREAIRQANQSKRLEVLPSEEERAKVKKLLADLGAKFSFPKG